MPKYLCLTAVAILMCCTLARAQDSTHQSQLSSTSTQKAVTPDAARTADIFTLGLGFGLDYGGFGGNIAVYPQENIGFFLGFGFAVAGFGYNAGIKLRALPHSKVRPFIVGMYGYYAAVAVSNDPQANKLFYGPTAGAGLDIGSTTVGKGYLSLALLVPFRSPDAQNYIDQLTASGVSFSHSLPSVTFSIGYRFILN